MKKLSVNYCTARNFGDKLNIDIPRDLFGIEVVKGGKISSEAVFIGSMLGSFFIGNLFSFRRLKGLFFRSSVIVWGAGFMNPEYKKRYAVRRFDIRAVRGYLTLERMKKITGKNLENVVVGDPGLLCNRLIDVSKIKKKYKLGIIPHIDYKNHKLLKKIKVKNSTVIDLSLDPKEFLPKIAECENIISSALHGLVAADSLGIPNIRMIIPNHDVKDFDYKYNDYYSAFGMKGYPIIDLRKRGFTDSDLPLKLQIPKSKIDKICKDLIKSFPYKK